MPLTTAQLTPLQCDALAEALRSPTHALVRTASGYIAQHPRESTSGLKRVRLFTGRLLNMLERDNLVDFDQAPWPNRATRTKLGLALAEQLRAGPTPSHAKAVRA
jgi:hypothetical protein